MTKFLALIAVAALMVSASDPAFAGRRHRNCCCGGRYVQAGWYGAQYGNAQYGNAQANWSNGYYQGQNGSVTTGYPPSESSFDANINSTTRTNAGDVNINSSTRGNVAPAGAAARQDSRQDARDSRQDSRQDARDSRQDSRDDASSKDADSKDAAPKPALPEKDL
jgi:hypothetical protein